MRHALVVMGTAGSGKSRIGSALATALAVPFIEGDAFHPPENIAQMAAGIPLDDDNRAGWLRALAELLRVARAGGAGVVLTCSALKRRYRDILRNGDDTIRFIALTGSASLLRDRLNARTGHYMPASLLDSQLAALELPQPDESAFTYDITPEPDVIVAAIVARLQDAPVPHTT